ncbi:MAG: hypothetical protein KUG73_13335 [Pseudomonadales bacterium]|nr:hypothetical protein [Pseudomonadales bacterium]
MTAQESIIEKIVLDKQPKQQNSLQDMVRIGFEALKIFPPFYIQSILGAAYKWLPPFREHSEFTILNPWKPLATMQYLGDISIPSFPHAPSKWVRTFAPPLITDVFWRASGYHQQMDPFDSETSFIREKWFFVNGIGTNETLAKINSNFLSEMFRRPVTIINNATNSIPLDVYQCVVGHQVKTNPSIEDQRTMTEPAYVATIALIEALADPEVDKIVLVNHSQGTIVTGNVLKALGSALQVLKEMEVNPTGTKEMEGLNLLERLALEKLPDISHPHVVEAGGIHNYALEILTKLEVYTFANCASEMTYLAYLENEKGDKIGLPYIENIANKNDIIARIGVLSPFKGKGDDDLIEIDGPVFERKESSEIMGTWGHLLNHCYLYAISDYLKDAGSRSNPFPSQIEGDSSMPRLYGYFAGQRQSSYL